MIQEQEIWEKFKAGDKSALSYVYFSNFRLMFQYGIKFIKDPEFIKDCIQDVFINLVHAGINLGATDNIRFYLFKALKNNILKNRDRRRKEETFEILPFRFELGLSVEDELIEKESHSEKAKLLFFAMESLSDRQREIIYLRYQCGLKYDEISELMQISNDSARKLVYRTVHILREKIGGRRSSMVLFYVSRIDKYVLQHNFSCPRNGAAGT